MKQARDARPPTPATGRTAAGDVGRRGARRLRGRRPVVSLRGLSRSGSAGRSISTSSPARASAPCTPATSPPRGSRARRWARCSTCGVRCRSIASFRWAPPRCCASRGSCSDWASTPRPLPAHDGIPERLPGLFDTEWLEKLVSEHIEWTTAAAQPRRTARCRRWRSRRPRSPPVARWSSSTPRRARPLPWANDPFVIGAAARDRSRARARLGGHPPRLSRRPYRPHVLLRRRAAAEHAALARPAPRRRPRARHRPALRALRRGGEPPGAPPRGGLRAARPTCSARR